MKLRSASAFLAWVAVAVACAGRPTSQTALNLAAPAQSGAGAREIHLTGFVGHHDPTPTVIIRQQGGRVTGMIVTSYGTADDSASQARQRVAAGATYGCREWELAEAGYGQAWLCRVPLARDPQWAEYLTEIDSFLRRESPPPDPRLATQRCVGGNHWFFEVHRDAQQTRTASLEGLGGDCWPDTADAIAYNRAGWDLLTNGLQRMASSRGRSASIQRQ